LKKTYITAELCRKYKIGKTKFNEPIPQASSGL
jgi:hypothetical protein